MDNKPTHSISGDDNWLCKDCGKDCIIERRDYYMVTHKLWKKFGVGRGMLCMDCMENRIGRKLSKSDILVCPQTTYSNPYTKSILNGE